MTRNLRQSDGLAGLLTMLIIVLTVVATFQLSAEAAEHDVLSGDRMVSSWIQRASIPGVSYPVEFFNWIGRPIPLTLLTGLFAVALMSRRRYAEAILVLPTTATHGVN